ncbi:MAG: cobalamin B12-binding domain-containing protein [Elusimicrobia bacterium]|nr:cobalamin B12-binding domain-containing protein [Elusimicrobiota bacterium]
MKQPKVLLVSLSPSSDSFGEEGKFRFSIFQRRPFIGLYYLSSALENAGYSSEVLCQHGGNFKLPDLIEKISCQEYLFLGIYIQFIGKEKTIRYISEIKKNLPHIKIIAGGPGYIEYEDFLNAGADIVCAGEAEETIVEVADALSKNSDITSIKGIHYILDEKYSLVLSGSLLKTWTPLAFPIGVRLI